MRQAKLIPLILILMIVLNGCSSLSKAVNNNLENNISKDSPAEKADKRLKLGMVIDSDTVEDKSFNELAWQGMKKSEKLLHTEISYKTTSDTNKYIDNFKKYAMEKEDLTFGIGYATKDSIIKAAMDNNEIKYVLVDADTSAANLHNLLAISFREQEAAFLVGYIAGKMTKSNIVGFMGGMKDQDNIIRFRYGYEAGVKKANHEANILVDYANSYTDPAKGKEIALRMYAHGADIIFHAAGSTGNGLIEAAMENGKYAIGVDKDQNEDAPDNVITSAMKNIDTAIFKTVEDYENGKWYGGNTVEFGLAENGVGIAPSSNKLVPEEILSEVEAIRVKIISGNIVVPSNEKEYLDFLKNRQGMR